MVDLDELRQELNPNGVPDFEANARDGIGVFETLKAVSKLVLTELKKSGDRIEQAVRAVLKKGETLTYDLVGPDKASKMSEVTSAIIDAL